MSFLDFIGERERLKGGCRALGLTVEQIAAEMAKHHITLRGLYEALARGWTQDSPVHPLDYKAPELNPAEITRLLNEIGNGGEGSKP